MESGEIGPVEEYGKFYEVEIKEIMQKDLPMIEKDAPIDRVLPLLTEATHVWVTESEEKRKVVGVITEHDVLSILAPSRPTYGLGFPDMRSLHRGTAEDVMTKKLIKCSPEDTAKEVLDLMMKWRIRRLPVIKGDNVIVGEIRLHDLLEKFISSVLKGRD